MGNPFAGQHEQDSASIVHVCAQIPSLPPNSVVVMDNSGTHLNDSFLDALIAAGHSYIWLPTYSPALNAIGVNLCMVPRSTVR